MSAFVQISYISSSVICLMLVFYIFIREFSSSSRIFSIIVSLISLLGIFYFLKNSTTSYYYYNIYLKILTIIFIFIPPLLFIFIYRFTKHGVHLRRRIKFTIFIIPILSSLVSLTNDSHHLFYTLTADINNSTFVENFHYWAIIYFTFSYSLVVIVCIITIKYAVHSYHIYKKQSVILILAVVIPTITNIIGLMNEFRHVYQFYQQLSFVISIFLIGYAIFKFRLFDLSPVAHQLITKTMDDGMIVLDRNNTVVDCNPAAAILLGFDSGSIVGRNIEEFCSLASKLNIDDHKSTGKIEFEKKIENKTHFFEINVSSLENKKSKIGKLLLFHDVTERRQNEKLLTELNLMKDRLISIIGHDLRNPFTTVNGYLKLLSNSKNGFKEEEKSEILSKVTKSATRASDLLENLLGWAKINTGSVHVDKRRLDIKNIIENIVELFSASIDEKKLSINMNIQSDHEVVFDEQMFATIMRNLISNAIKFSYEKNSILIKSRNENESVYVSVQDFGTGIKSEDFSSLFIVDKQIKKAGTNGEIGTGMGLVICKEFAELNGAEIIVNSEESKGSEFILRIVNNTK